MASRRPGLNKLHPVNLRHVGPNTTLILFQIIAQRGNQKLTSCTALVFFLLFHRSSSPPVPWLPASRRPMQRHAVAPCCSRCPPLPSSHLYSSDMYALMSPGYGRVSTSHHDDGYFHSINTERVSGSGRDPCTAMSRYHASATWRLTWLETWTTSFPPFRFSDC